MSADLPGLAATGEITDLDLRGVSEAIQARRISSVEATQAYLRRIEQHNAVLQAYITVTPGLALAQAQRCDAELARGESRGPLHGVPIALKDLIAVAGECLGNQQAEPTAAAGDQHVGHGGGSPSSS